MDHNHLPANFQRPSILAKLKSSIDNVRCISGSHSCKQLEIKLTNSYILREKALDVFFKSPATPKLEEPIIEKNKKSPASKFSTKIEFVKPQQRHQEESPLSVDSDSEEKPPEHKEQESILSLIEVEDDCLQSSHRKEDEHEDRFVKIASGRLMSMSKAEDSQSLEDFGSWTHSKNDRGVEKRTQMCENPLRSDFSNETRSELERIEDTEKRKNWKALEMIEVTQRARTEVEALRKNKQELCNRLGFLQSSLSTILEARVTEAKTIQSIEAKLLKLESQQLAPEEDLRLPEAISKILKLEREILQLRSLKDSSISTYEEELKDVYMKLKDLQECNEILNEMVTCFKKEPLIIEKEFKHAETFIGSFDSEVIGTIKLSGLLNSESIIQEAYAKKEQLTLTKDRLESEYRALPSDSRSLLNKKRKLALEYELSLNYSQLVSIDSKIKRYTSDFAY